MTVETFSCLICRDVSFLSVICQADAGQMPDEWQITNGKSPMTNLQGGNA